MGSDWTDDFVGTRLNNMDFVTVTAERDNMVVTVPSEIDITLGKDDKIMLWQDMTKLCTALRSVYCEITELIAKLLRAYRFADGMPLTYKCDDTSLP